MDMEGFRKFLAAKGIAEQKIEENIKNAGFILKFLSNGIVTLAHMDEIERMAVAKNAEPRIIESLKRTGSLMMDHQRSSLAGDKSNVPLSKQKPLEQDKYPYGFYSTWVFKISFVIILLMVAASFALKYIPFDPDSFLGRNKMKLDELVYPLPLVGGLSKAVKDAYENAKHAVKIRDLKSAEGYLKKTVKLKPDFTEAWYNLGATQTRIAVDLAREDLDEAALSKFREAVLSKKRSKELMDRNIWFIYKDYEQDEVRSDVKQALKDVDEVLENEQALLFALKIWKE